MNRSTEKEIHKPPSDGLEVAQELYRPPETPEKRRKPKKEPKAYKDLFGTPALRERPERKQTATFRGTGRREATPSRPHRHGKVKWWRGEIHVEGVNLDVVASPSGISLPAGAHLDEDLYRRVEEYLTREAVKLNRQWRGGGSRG